MKREAAVLGPTPQFVRWAVARACPFRDLNLDELPRTTFHQLRGLDAVAQAVVENRYHAGYGFARSTQPTTALDAVKAIPIREVLRSYGLPDLLDQHCGHCPANGRIMRSLETEREMSVSERRGRWAGCFGYLSADPAWAPSLSQEAFSIDEVVVQRTDCFISNYLEKFRTLFPDNLQNWFGLWQNSRFVGPRLAFLIPLFEQLQSLPGACEEYLQEVQKLVSASVQAEEADLPIHFELVPAGCSDGLHWEIHSHCRNCKFPKSNAKCRNCGDNTKEIAKKKSKVLGHRPYLRLVDIVGRPRAEQLVREYMEKVNVEP